VLLKYRRLIAGVFVLIVTLILSQTYATTPLYLAHARLLINDERSTSVVNFSANDPAYWQDTAPYYETQYRILQSRALGERVVARLDLATVPEFTGEEAARGLFANVRALRLAIGARLRALSTEPSPAGPVVVHDADREAAWVGVFLSRMRVEPVKGTRLVDVYFTAADPAFAARAVNTLAEEYVEQNLDLRLQNTSRMLVWLTDELGKQQEQVTRSETAMAEYRESQNALSLEDRQNIVVSRLNHLNDAVTKAKTNRLQKQALYQQVRRLDPMSVDVDAVPVIAQHPTIITLRTQVAGLEAQMARVSSRYGPKHPEYQKLEAALANATRQLRLETANVVDSIRSDYQVALSEENSLSASLEAQKGEAMDLNRKSVSYVVLQRQAESERLVYQQLLQQEKELRVIANSRANNVQVMDRAQVPQAPFTPNPRRDWLLAIAVGLTLAVGLAFGLEYLDDTVKTPDDIARRLGLPLLGLIPAVRGEDSPVLNAPVPHDFGEAFRSLRTSLVFSSGSEKTRIIAVTSSQPLEGKTTAACNLAMALALGGGRVLLIDADMRRPALHKLLGVPNVAGLSHLLVGQAPVREAIRPTTEPNLYLISAGVTPPNPSELLGSSRMKALLTSLTSGPFDWVIVDTPPVLAVTDAVILAGQVSGIAFVIGSEMTRRAHAQHALEMLMTARPPMIGAVLNRVDFDRNKYYYSRYYGYQHKSYYGQAQTAA
jgi:polysaccharide biosynthesis transport protein